MPDVIFNIIIAYGICSFINLVFSWCGMWVSSEERYLTRLDILAQIALVFTGFFGLVYVFVLLILYAVEKYKEKKAEEFFRDDGGSI
jgi:hypothetical protein